jgi:hypothetical protein
MITSKVTHPSLPSRSHPPRTGTQWTAVADLSLDPGIQVWLTAKATDLEVAVGVVMQA